MTRGQLSEGAWEEHVGQREQLRRRGRQELARVGNRRKGLVMQACVIVICLKPLEGLKQRSVVTVSSDFSVTTTLSQVWQQPAQAHCWISPVTSWAPRMDLWGLPAPIG